MQIDRLSGEILPDYEHFCNVELGAMIKNSSGKTVFKRNALATKVEEIEGWRADHNNTGVFRSMLWSNESNYLDKYNEPETLFLAPLTFDMDASKDPSEDAWKALVHECRVLVRYLVSRYKLPDDSCIRIWFSGGRGFHIEVPYQVLGIFAHHDLNRIFGFAAREAQEACNAVHMDMSLYGGKHLFRLENSVHQRTGSYKWPMKASELGRAYDYSFLSKVSKTERAGDLWTIPEPKVETLRHWDQIVARSQEDSGKRSISTIQNTPDTYDRHDFTCIEDQFKEDYLVAEGTRYQTAYILAKHLFQNSFSYEAAQAEIMQWASNSCSPPYTQEEDLQEWGRMLDQVYTVSGNPIGCSYIQRTTTLCREHECPIGQRMLRARSKV